MRPVRPFSYTLSVPAAVLHSDQSESSRHRRSGPGSWNQQVVQPAFQSCLIGSGTGFPFPDACDIRGSAGAEGSLGVGRAHMSQQGAGAGVEATCGHRGKAVVSVLYGKPTSMHTDHPPRSRIRQLPGASLSLTHSWSPASLWLLSPGTRAHGPA